MGFNIKLDTFILSTQNMNQVDKITKKVILWVLFNFMKFLLVRCVGTLIIWPHFLNHIKIPTFYWIQNDKNWFQRQCQSKNQSFQTIFQMVLVFIVIFICVFRKEVIYWSELVSAKKLKKGIHQNKILSPQRMT